MNSKQQQQFTAYLQDRNIIQKTIAHYMWRLNHYMQWLKLYTNKEPEQAEKKDILSYLQHLQEQLHLAIGTRQQALIKLYRYYDFLQKEQRILKNPAQLIKLRGTKQRIVQRKILTLEEMQQLADTHYYLHVQSKNLHVKPQDLQIELRNHVALLLHLYQGIKAKEVKLLRLEDLDLRKATINIPATRKSNARKLPLNATQIGLLQEYINNVLPSLRNPKKLLINAVSKNFIQQLKKIYPKFIDFEQLRASIITHWIQTQGLRIAQYNAGHRYISSTEKYLTKDIESLKNDITKYHPI